MTLFIAEIYAFYYAYNKLDIFAHNITAIYTNCFQNLIQHVQATRQKTMRQ